MIKYPPKTRSVAIGKLYPSHTRDAKVGAIKGGPAPRPQNAGGKPPAKGVLTKGGGHG